MLGHRHLTALMSVSYLMQLLGSLPQSILHMNLSQCNQPIVGFSARPLSSASTAGLIKPINARRHAALDMFAFKLNTHTGDNKRLYLLLGLFPCATRIQPASPDDWLTRGPIQSKCVCDCPMAFRADSFTTNEVQVKGRSQLTRHGTVTFTICFFKLKQQKQKPCLPKCTLCFYVIIWRFWINVMFVLIWTTLNTVG